MADHPDDVWINLSAMDSDFRNNLTVWAYRYNTTVCRILSIIFLDRNTSNVATHSDVRDDVSFYMTGIGGTLLCALGLLGNIVSLVVIIRRLAQTSTYSYLTALAVSDSLMLLCSGLLFAKDWRRPVHIQPNSQQQWDQGLHPYYFPYVHPIAFTCQVLSIWLTLAFTVDRYIMICHPFDGARLCTVGRARRAIVVLFACAVTFNVPKFFEYRTATTSICRLGFNSTSLITNAVSDLTSFGSSPVFLELYHSWFYILFVCGVPLISLVVLNSALLRAVRQSMRKQKELTASEAKNNDTTVMLIAVVIIFFICQVPALISRIIWSVIKNPTAFRELHLFLINEVGNLCIILNSAINFVPYYFFGKRFRAEFRRLFCGCISHRRYSNSVQYSVQQDNHNNHNHSVAATTKFRLVSLQLADMQSPEVA